MSSIVHTITDECSCPIGGKHSVEELEDAHPDLYAKMRMAEGYVNSYRIREELLGLMDSLDDSVTHEDIHRALLKLYQEIDR